MCSNNNRRNVEIDLSYKLVSVYDPEYFELKNKYDELCKAVLEYVELNGLMCSGLEIIDVEDRLIKLAKGETI